MNGSTILIALSVLVFGLALFSVHIGSVNLVTLGLLLFAAGHLSWPSRA